MEKKSYLCTVELKTTKKMGATTVRKHRMASPVTKAWNLAKDMDDREKLELVSIIIDSMKPTAAKAKEADEEYSLRPFTMEELNARIDQAEAEIAAGLGIPDEDVWRELEEEFAREDAEEEALQLAAYHEEEQLATV